MAKKKHRKIQQLVAKKQQLQNLAHPDQAVSVLQPAVQAVPTAASSLPTQPVVETTSWAGHRELRRTLISVIIIGLLLTGTVIYSHKSARLLTVGDWLYTHLHLKS